MSYGLTTLNSLIFHNFQPRWLWRRHAAFEKTPVGTVTLTASNLQPDRLAGITVRINTLLRNHSCNYRCTSGNPIQVHFFISMPHLPLCVFYRHIKLCPNQSLVFSRGRLCIHRYTLIPGARSRYSEILSLSTEIKDNCCFHKIFFSCKLTEISLFRVSYVWIPSSEIWKILHSSELINSGFSMNGLSGTDPRRTKLWFTCPSVV